MKSKIIVISGDLASGKSTFSHLLSERYQILVFNKDDLKEVVGDEYLELTEANNKKLSEVSVKIIFLMLRKALKAHCSIIIESNFHEDEYPILGAIFKEFQADVLGLELRADDEILYERYLKRAEGKRHPVHLIHDFSSFENFKEYLQESRAPLPLETVLKINADRFDYQTDDELLSKIDDFMK